MPVVEQRENNSSDLDYPTRELLELKNMLTVGRLITEATIRRKKTLGAHFMTSDA